MNELMKLLSAIVLLIVSTWFGYLGLPSQMGLAILAGALGLAFSNIDKISEFSGAGFSAKMKEEVQAIIDKETEPDIEDKDQESADLGVEHSKIIAALNHSKYTWRSLAGISKESNITEPEAWKALVWLTKHGLVRTGNKNKTGAMIWALTRVGRAVAANDS